MHMFTGNVKRKKEYKLDLPYYEFQNVCVQNAGRKCGDR
jgi:hypothetical protein